MMKDWIYLAGVFDARGFVKFTYGSTYSYAVFFNFTEDNKKTWESIRKIVSKYFPCRIYRIKRSKGKKEYQLWIGSKKSVYEFLKAILPYSNRKEEIATYLKLLEEKGYKKKLR